MLERPFIRLHPYSTYNTVCELTETFNEMLIDEAKKSKYSLVIKPDFETNEETFDSFGNLTPMGKQQYWKHIDSQIKTLEEKDDAKFLKPWIKNDQNGSGDGKMQGNPPKSDDSNNQNGESRKFYQNSEPRQDYQNYQYQNRQRDRRPNQDIWGQAGRISRMERSRGYCSKHRY